MDYEPKQIIIYTVEIGGVNLSFQDLKGASEFFAKIVEAPFMKIKREGWSEDYIPSESKMKVSMKQETINLYPNEEAYNFVKSKKNKNEE
jgi:hypothetical protein